jgi:hypothetical protein
MDNRIRTYEDLLQEEQRLIQQLKGHEVLIREDLISVRQHLAPVTRVFNNVTKAFTRDNRAPLLNFGLEMGIDVFVRRVLLAKAGWFTKIVVPYLLKNYSSHLIGHEKRVKMMQKIQGFFAKLRPKPEQPAPDAAAAAYTGDGYM